MTDWRELTDELDAWAAAGPGAAIWWRDDDAVAPGAALDRLLDLAARHGAPLALAVIPARAEPALAERLRAAAGRVTLLQHGYAHRNHAGPGEKKVELGGHRPAAAALDELGRGRARLAALFGEPAPAVLVPPWNRIAPGLTGALPGLGFAGLSAYGARRQARAAPGLVQVNTHVDILRWRDPRGFLGAAEALALLVGHLRDRRAGRADPAEPSGLLSHHLAHDEAAWAFLDRLLAALAGHPGARLVGAAEAFAPAPARDDRGAA